MRNTAQADGSASSAPSAESQSARSADAAHCVLPNDHANAAIEGRWITFEYCVSLVAVTLRQSSRPVFIKADARIWIRSLPYCLISLLFGWWGIPWGIVYTPVTIFANLTGGCDITAQVEANSGAKT